jgi:hypothetical protein
MRQSPVEFQQFFHKIEAADSRTLHPAGTDGGQETQEVTEGKAVKHSHFVMFE